MIVESGPAYFPQGYPHGDIRLSIPRQQDPFFNKTDSTWGVHVLYRGNGGRFFEDAYPANSPSGEQITYNDYQETLGHYGIPQIPEYQDPRTIWVANRKQVVEVAAPVGPETLQRKITMKRTAQQPEEVTRVERGIEMINDLCETDGFDPYDITYLTGSTRRTVQTGNMLDQLLAYAADNQVVREVVPEGFPQKVIRAIVFPR
jgi:hypothetical protein